MKIQLNIEDLQEGLKKAKLVAPKKASVPVLECAMIKAENGSIKIIGTSLDSYIFLDIEGTVIEDGTVLIHQSDLKTIDKLKGYTTITADENNITFKANRNLEMRIGYRTEDFPTFPDYADAETIQTIKNTSLLNVLKLEKVCGTNMARPILGNIYCDGNYFYGCDSYRLGRIASDTLSTEKYMINMVAFPVLKSLLKSKQEFNVTTKKNKKYTVMQFNNTTYIYRNAEGLYLDIEKVIPTMYDINARATDKTSFVDTIDFMCDVAKEKENNYIVFDMADGNLNISATGLTKKSDEDIKNVSVDYNSNLKIGFNGQYVLDALKLINTNEFEMQFKGAVNPMTIQNETELYLVLPMRLKEVA